MADDVVQALLESIPCVAFLARVGTREVAAANQAALDAGIEVGTECYRAFLGQEEPCSFCRAPEVWRTGEARWSAAELGGRLHDAHWVPAGEGLYVHYYFDTEEDARSEDGGRAGRALEEALFGAAKRAREHTALLAASRLVTGNERFEAAARGIFDAARAVLGATAGYVAVLGEDGETNDIIFLESGGVECTVDPDLPMPVRGLRERAYATGETVWENDFDGSEWAALLPEGHVRLENVLFAPITRDGDGGRTIGVVGLANKPGGFSEEDARLATVFGELATMAFARVETLDRLEEVQEYADNLIGTASVMVVGLDNEGRVRLLNEAGERLTGYSRAELEGKDWFATLVPRERFPWVLEEFERLMAGGPPKTFENPIITKSGEERLISWRNSEVREHGRIVGTLSFGIDMTERLTAEKALRDSEYWLRQSQRVGRMGVLRFEAQGGRWTSSETLDDIFGIDAAHDRSTQGWLGLIHPDDLEATKRHLMEAVATGGTFDCEYRILRPSDGEVRWVHGRGEPVRDEEGNVIERVALVQDITERKKAEAALRRSEETLREAERIGRVGSAREEIGSGKVELSASALRLLGFGPDETPSLEDIALRAHPDDREKVRRAMREAHVRTGSFALEHRVVMPSGSIRHLGVSGETLADPTGRPREVIVLLADITERKELEQLKDDFLSMVSHELRTPISSIIGYQALLERLDTSALPPHAAGALEAIRRVAWQMSGLVDELLDVSRANSGKLQLALEDVDVERVVRDTVAALPPSPLHEIVVDVEPGVGSLRCDPARFGHAVRNVIGNAVKFSPQGGLVLIEGRVDGDRFRLSVQDEGIGIPPEDLDRIFDRFEQGDMSSSRGFAGVGMGLHIARALVGAHGGTICVESTVGKGSTFVVDMPLAGPPDEPPGEGEPGPR